MHDFLQAFLGGALLGMAVVGYLYVNGRIAGISGIIAQVLNPKTVFKTPAIWFLSGLLVTPFIYGLFVTPSIQLNTPPVVMILAGLLVGFGTRLGSGCTSGHGICGISRLSMRSIVSTMVFMAAAAATVYIIRHVLGGL